MKNCTESVNIEMAIYVFKVNAPHWQNVTAQVSFITNVTVCNLSELKR